MRKFEIPSLNTAIHGLEDGIITLSGPALAISGIIAGIDLVTGGNMLKSIGWLAMTWAICLLLTLDFQVLALGARAHRVYLSNKQTNRKVFEIVLAVLVACAISYVSIQMQSIIARSNSITPALSIDAATVQMGINPIALIWERSSLVLVLIFLSGWFREDEPEQVQNVLSVQVQQPDMEQAIEQRIAPLIEQLDERYSRRLEVTVKQVVEQFTLTIEQVTAPRLSAIQGTDVPQIAPPKVQDGSVGAKVHLYLEQQRGTGREPTLQEIMDSTGCSKGTAIRYRKG